MSRFRRTLGIAGGALLLLVIGAAIALLAIDPKQFVGPVLARVKAATGREVEVGGAIELKIGFAPRIVAHDVRLDNAPWGKAPSLLTTRQLELQVALLPLLRRHFDLVRVNLIEPVIALETNRDGRSNWELGAAPGGAAAPGSESRPDALGIGALSITRGLLTYRDGAGGSESRVTIDQLALSARDAKAPIEAEFRGDVDGTPVALAGKLGSIAAFSDRGAPFSMSVQGEIAGRKTAVAVRVVRADRLVQLQDIDATFGTSNLKGRVDVRDEGPKSAWTIDLASSALNVGDLPVARRTTPAAKPAVPANSSRFVFPETAMSFDTLRAHNATGEVTIGRLTLADSRTLDRVHARFTLRDGKLVAPTVQASGYGGTISGALTVDATRGRTPTLALRAEGRGLDLAALFAAAGVTREVRGGKTDVAIDVTLHGDSPRQWMSGISGSVRAVVGPASLVNARLDPTATFDQLAEAVNPFRTINPTTELQCAVIRLPLAGGIAQIDRSIAMETKEIEASMSGTVDFRSETIDLSIRPRVRHGIPIEIPQIAELVRFRGPFSAPTVTVDAVASAAMLARIGAAIGTGGLSVLGESIFAQVTAGAGACAVALGKPVPATAAPAKDTPKGAVPPTGADDLGKALKGLFGR